MKRIIVFIFACVLISSSAFAVSDIDIMITGHNMNCSVCGAQQITGDPVFDYNKGTATFDLTSKLHDVFFLDNDKVIGFGCVCRDPDQEIEFLAQCVTACYNFAGIQAGNTCYDAVLSQFMFARSGNELGMCYSIPGILIQITKVSFGYVFTLSVVN